MPAPLISQYRDATPTVQNYGTATAPTAGAVIATVTIPAGGTWEITAMASYGATADTANNVTLQRNGTAVLTRLLVPGVVNSTPVPVPVILTCATGDTVTINAVATGAAGSIYNAVLIARQVG